MRTLLLPLLLSAATAAPVQAFIVVVHTRDRVIVDYVCHDRFTVESGAAIRSVVQATGHLTWHVAGGVPPYTEVNRTSDASGHVCITVMDATGALATGCGRMLLRRTVEMVHCPINDPDLIEKAACDTLKAACDSLEVGKPTYVSKPIVEPDPPKPPRRKDPAIARRMDRTHGRERERTIGRTRYTDRRDHSVRYDRGTRSTGPAPRTATPVRIERSTSGNGNTSGGTSQSRTGNR